MAYPRICDVTSTLCKVLLTLCVVSTQLLQSKASQALVQGDEEIDRYHAQPDRQGGYQRGDSGSKWGRREEWKVKDYQRIGRRGSGYGSGMMADDDDEDHWQYSGSGSGYRDLGSQPPYKQGIHGRGTQPEDEDDMFIDNAYQTPKSDLINSGSARQSISIATVIMVTIAATLLWLNG